MQKHLVRHIAGLLVLFLAPVFCLSQVDRAGLSGTVTDISGKVIPGARVTALQTATGLVREAVSSTSGIYYIPELPVGLYRVTCTVAGFRQVVFENVAQTIGHTSKLDFTLQRGERDRAGQCPGPHLPTRRNERRAGRPHRVRAGEGPSIERPQLVDIDCTGSRGRRYGRKQSAQYSLCRAWTG